ncbi:hypothetical protein Halhy_3713 [Haliscomenobacter hydrossis DSM 1100]|uniref:Uncharacterized protein n=1 Tax=Haliscomenobacter hydrossis (strain ATCC 27775 / DSM 1100 / LMG 10767 / O) TaxID=760192 RepID=F4KZZ5_HALH1|nr:hypothetical protein Halhy_3713 [Haliscomenobacter hydrossis DSM 1100]
MGVKSTPGLLAARLPDTKPMIWLKSTILADLLTENKASFKIINGINWSDREKTYREPSRNG